MRFNFDSSAVTVANQYGVDLHIAKTYLAYVERVWRKERMGGRSTHRDSTRQKTYNAENKFMREFGRGVNFATAQEAQAFANQVFHSKSWEKHKTARACQTAPTIEFSARLNRFSGMAYYNRIVLAGTGMNAYILLHELAHTNGHRHHDFSFRKCLVDMVEEFMGRSYAVGLKSAFKEAGLKMSVRKLGEAKSFPEWFKTYERMERARMSRKTTF